MPRRPSDSHLHLVAIVTRFPQLQCFRRILRREKTNKDPYADSTDYDDAPGLDGASGTAREAGGVAVSARDDVVTAGTAQQPSKDAGEMRDGAVAYATGGRSSSDSVVPVAEFLVTAAGNGNFPCEPAAAEILSYQPSTAAVMHWLLLRPVAPPVRFCHS